MCMKPKNPVALKDMITDLGNTDFEIPVALGKTPEGENIMIDLRKAPHVLVAGTKQSGKTTLLHSIICSILGTQQSENVRFVLAGLKDSELSVYQTVTSLLCPVISDEDNLMKAMEAVADEIEDRVSFIKENKGYRIHSIGSYNLLAEKHGLDKLPYIVLIVDEFAPAMYARKGEFERLIRKITSVARILGIHLILTTGEPLLPNVITGTIWSNFPSTIALRMDNRISSKLILGQPGAEALGCCGEALYKARFDSPIIKFQSAFVDEDTVKAVAFYNSFSRKH